MSRERSNTSLWRAPVTAVVVMVLLRTVAAAGQAGSAPVPDPTLDPAAVVRIQLEALKNVDEPVPNAGIALVFRFASPGNRAQTGPLARFISLIRKSYPEMLNHRSADLIKTVVEGDQALQGVELIDHDGGVHRYLFVLSRQHQPPYKDCWMTDSVVNAPDEKPAQAV